jgi:hypothetical protein
VTFHLKHLSHMGRSLLNISKSGVWKKKTRDWNHKHQLWAVWRDTTPWKKKWGYETIHNPRKHHALLNSNTNLYPLPTCIPAMRQLSPPTHPTHPIVTVTCCHDDLGYLATLKAGNAKSLRVYKSLSPAPRKTTAFPFPGEIWWDNMANPLVLWGKKTFGYPLASSQFMAQDQHIMAYYPGSIQWPKDTRYLGQGAWRTGCGPQSFSCSPRCIASCFSGVPCWHSQPASAKTSLKGSPGFIANKWGGATTNTITPIGAILNPLLIYHWGSPKGEGNPMISNETLFVFIPLWLLCPNISIHFFMVVGLVEPPWNPTWGCSWSDFYT